RWPRMWAYRASIPFLSLGYNAKRITRASTTKAPPPQANSLTSGMIGLGPSSHAPVSWPAASVAGNSQSTSACSSSALRKSTRTATASPWIAVTTAVSTSAPCGNERTITGGVGDRSETDQDEHHEADQGERLGAGDAQEHRGAHHARSEERRG